jgi:hypothetical protein
MAELVNKETNKSVNKYISSIESDSKRKDSLVLLKMIQEITGFEPKVWGDNYFIGFGKYTYNRKNSKEEYEWFHVGFAPRKTKLTVYLTLDISKEEELLKKLGKCKFGKGCLYINKLADIDLAILKRLIKKSKDARWHQQ